MSEWLDSIVEILDEDDWAVGEHREPVLEAARDLDTNLPARGLFADEIRDSFKTWVTMKHYLVVLPAIDHHLPPTMTRTDTEIEVELGNSNQKAIENKRSRIEAARSLRIAHCIQMLEDGEEDSAAISQVAARDEWRAAKEKAKSHREYIAGLGYEE